MTIEGNSDASGRHTPGTRGTGRPLMLVPAGAPPADEALDAIPLAVERVRLDGTIGYRNPVAAAGATCRGSPTAWLDLWDDASRGAMREALHQAQTGSRQSRVGCRDIAGVPVRHEVTLIPLRHHLWMREVLAVSSPCAAEPAPACTGGGDEPVKGQVIALLARQVAEDARRLTALRQRLQHSEKMKLFGHFLAQIIHDVNNVFQVLHANLTLRERMPATPQPQASDRRALTRGTQLLRQLLDFSRREADQPATTDLAELLSGCHGMLRSLLNDAHSLELKIHAQPWPVAVNSSALESVLFNLVANARDAMPGSGTCTIEMRNCSESSVPQPLTGDYVCLAIRDTGCGMPPDILARAGDAYNTTKANGTGLGLSSAFELAESAGGCVTIDTAVDVGTRVALYLRRAGMRADMRTAPGATGHEHLHGDASVLVAHGDEGVRTAVAASLRALQYQVLEADSAALAAALITTGLQLDLVIAQKRMGEREGMPVQETARAHRPRAAVIVIDEPDARRDGVRGLTLRQPIFMPLLLRGVLEQLNRLPAVALSAQALAAADRLRNRLRNPEVRDLFDAWQDLSKAYGRLPALEEMRFRPQLEAIGYVVEVLDGPVVGFKVLEFGSELARRLGRNLAGITLSLAEEPMLGTLRSAWTRCLTGAPHFDYARFRPGSDVGESFERLLLPVSANGERVTHLVGVTAFDQPGGAAARAPA